MDKLHHRGHNSILDSTLELILLPTIVCLESILPQFIPIHINGCPHPIINYELSFMNQWLDAHIHDAEYMIGKPPLLTEFGKSWKDSGFSSIEKGCSFQRCIFLDIFIS